MEWISQKENVIYSCGKKVNQINPETNQIVATYNTINEAYKFLGKNYSGNISECCSGKKKLYLNYKWSFSD